MPVYNGVSWIGECIESIRQQTDTNWELLVLDDHSTDGTTELVLKLAEEDSRILPILRQKNGVSAARNEGLEKRKENLSRLSMRTISWIRRCSLCFGRC